MTTTPLDAEIGYFDAHIEELAKQYPGKFVVIKDQSVIGGYQEMHEALAAGAARFGMESFLVRRTDQKAASISIPALTLGILRAGTHV